MSDVKVAVNNSVSFNDYLKVQFKDNGTAGSFYQNAEPETQRAIAVSCALELIRAESTNVDGYRLDANMQYLSKYADTIQEALKVNNDKS